MAGEHDWNQPSRRSAFASPGSGKLAGGMQFSVPDIALERRREISSEANVPNDRGALSES
jgi:hypothetical protein